MIQANNIVGNTKKAAARDSVTNIKDTAICMFYAKAEFIYSYFFTTNKRITVYQHIRTNFETVLETNSMRLRLPSVFYSIETPTQKKINVFHMFNKLIVLIIRRKTTHMSTFRE